MNKKKSQVRRLSWLRFVASVFKGIIFVAALVVIAHELEGVRLHDVFIQLRRIGRWHLVGAVVLTALSYILMIGYDDLGLRYLDHRLGFMQISFTSFLGYAFNNNLGTLLGAGTVRVRIYGAWGLSNKQILSLILFSSSCVWLGLATLTGSVLLIHPIPSNVNLPLFVDSISLWGFALMALVAGYLGMCLWWRKIIHIWRWSFQLPSIRLAVIQILIGSLDWFLVALVLYVLLIYITDVPFITFLAVFLLAQFAGIVSNVPGGLGVFETVLLVMLSAQVEHQAILRALVLFRAIYYLLPLAIAGLSLGGLELLRHRRSLGMAYSVYQRFARPVVPLAMAVLVFVAGLSMLFAGVLPTSYTRLHLLHDWLPLTAIEISHLLGSVVGTLLLFLAIALYRRINVAYGLGITLLGAGMVLSLLRGLHWEVALTQGIVLMALLPCRSCFYRRARLLEPRTSSSWLAAVGLAVGASIALGLFAFRHVPYRNELWWQVSLTGDVPRFLRAALASVLVVLAFSVVWLLRPTRIVPLWTGKYELDIAQRIAGGFPHTYAHLALLGDKQLLFNPQRNGFIMYGVQGGSLIAMGDPVAADRQQEELAWQFRELCDRYGMRCVFYQVDGANLPLYVDMGLFLVNLGEEARVPLKDFSLEGSKRKSLRQDVNRAVKAGCSFEVVPAEQVALLIPYLKTISDAWLTLKHGQEKGFSLGFFNEDYLSRLSIAAVRHEGKIVAFANLWLGGDEELSPDLIRHLPDAPPGTMDFLITQLLLWGKEKQYQWFNLGGAPFSGLEDRTLAPLWHRLGTQLYRHGEHFYNFKGLRQFKEKFDPVWEPKYLATSAGLSLPAVLVDLTLLIGKHAVRNNGGIKLPK